MSRDIIIDEIHDFPADGGEVLDIEDLAAEVVEEVRARPTPVQSARVKPAGCPLCFGQGVRNDNELARLWGYTCWGCGGWGFIIDRGRAVMRGPVVRRPGTHFQPQVRR